MKGRKCKNTKIHIQENVKIKWFPPPPPPGCPRCIDYWTDALTHNITLCLKYVLHLTSIDYIQLFAWMYFDFHTFYFHNNVFHTSKKLEILEIYLRHFFGFSANFFAENAEPFKFALCLETALPIFSKLCSDIA